MCYDPELVCLNCGWQGDYNQLDGIKCPECGSTTAVEDYTQYDPPRWDMG